MSNYMIFFIKVFQQKFSQRMKDKEIEKQILFSKREIIIMVSQHAKQNLYYRAGNTTWTYFSISHMKHTKNETTTQSALWDLSQTYCQLKLKNLFKLSQRKKSSGYGEIASELTTLSNWFRVAFHHKL